VKLHVVLCAVALAGCATFHIEPTNQPLPTVGSNLAGNDPGLSGDEGDLFVGLAFSGGGMRASAFSYGKSGAQLRAFLEDRFTSLAAPCRSKMLSTFVIQRKHKLVCA
jgi:hypothetical protein